MSDRCFEYPVRAYPHHTDYGNVVWHGAYIAWLEETRVEVLRYLGKPYESLVAAGMHLVVADMNLRYRRPLSMGVDAAVLARVEPLKGIRLAWLYELRSQDRQTLFLEAKIDLAATSLEGKLFRRIPPVVRDLHTDIVEALAGAEGDIRLR